MWSLNIENAADWEGSLNALYYPHIHFRSRRWLRTAMLYYDSVSRIVPAGLDPDDRTFYRFPWISDELLEDVREMTASGIVRCEAPDSSVTEIANEFFDFAMDNLVDSEKRSRLVPELAARSRYYTIHPAKIDPELLRVLEELKLAHQKQGDPYSDWNIEPVTGGLYMLFLADRMAGNRQLVSDKPVYQSLLYTRLPGDESSPTHDDRPFRLASAVLQTVVPVDLDCVNLDKLFRIREDFADQRRRFQDKLEQIGKDLQQASDADTLAHAVERHRAAILDQYETQLDEVRKHNLIAGHGLFSVSVPSYVTSAWGLGLTAPQVLVGLGVVGLSAVALKFMFDRKISRRNPFTYLMSVSRALKPNRLIDEIITLNLEFDEGDDDDFELAMA